MGHRNPQGIAFQPGTGRVYAAEHGPNTDDEVNLIVAGGNYGWPCYTGAGNVNFADPSCGPAGSYRNPAWASGTPTLATSGLAFADGVSWGDFDGNLFVAQLKETDLRRFTPSVDGTTMTHADVLFDGTWGRLRAVVRGPAGQLYLDHVERDRRQSHSDRRRHPDRDSSGRPGSVCHRRRGQRGNMGAGCARGLRGDRTQLPRCAGRSGRGRPRWRAAPPGHERAGYPPRPRQNWRGLPPGFHPGSWVVRRWSPTPSWPSCRGTRPERSTRLSGVDRYETAAAISAATFSPGVGAAVLAIGSQLPRRPGRRSRRGPPWWPDPADPPGHHSAGHPERDRPPGAGQHPGARRAHR